jgi:hypothetical protein
MQKVFLKIKSYTIRRANKTWRMRKAINFHNLVSMQKTFKIMTYYAQYKGVQKIKKRHAYQEWKKN